MEGIGKYPAWLIEQEMECLHLVAGGGFPSFYLTSLLILRILFQQYRSASVPKAYIPYQNNECVQNQDLMYYMIV
jgi:hypothetical protein